MAERLAAECDGDPKVVRSPCLGLCEAAPAVLFQEAGEGAVSHAVAPADAGPDPCDDPRHGRARAAARAGAASRRRAAAAACGRGGSDVVARLPRARRLRRAGTRDRARSRRRDPTGDQCEAPGPRRCRVPDGGQVARGGRSARKPQVRRRQRRRIGARHLQGSRAHGERSVRPDRGAHDRRVRHGGGRPATCTSEASTRARRNTCTRRSRRRGRPPCSGRTSCTRASPSTSSCAAAPGAYICGEETALFNSIEGKRGEPRNKPPFPVTHGVFGRPTAINNVETLLNVLQILELGADTYAALGTEGSTGTRLFCLSGHVEHPGVYEAEHGITLAEAIDMAGGLPRRRADQGDPARGCGRRVPRAGPPRRSADVRRRPGGRVHARLRRDHGARCERRSGRSLSADRAILPRRVLWPVRAVPRRHRSPGGGPASTRRRPHHRDDGRRARLARGRRGGHARRVDLRPRTDRRQRGAIGDRHLRPVRLGEGA